MSGFPARRARHNASMKKSLLAVTALAALALAACETPDSAAPDRATCAARRSRWHSPGRATTAISGDITATFGTGDVFKGEYVQISRDIRVERLDPLWDGWDRPARKNWRYWNRGCALRFVRENSGRVLANLRSDDGEYMRCRFTLVSP